MKADAARPIDSNGNQRIEFAHALRGLAAFSVLISHFCGVFWANPGAVAALLNVETPTIAPPTFISPLHFSPHFNYGSFGVAVFFLISGFVIPFSLQKLSAPAFLIARAFRIYPVYLFSLCVSLGAVWLLGRYGGGEVFHMISVTSSLRPRWLADGYGSPPLMASVGLWR